MKNSTDKTIIVATIAFTLVIVVIACLPLFQNNDTDNDVPSGIKWDGNSITANRDKPEKCIAIPCFTDLIFVANQTSQKVNIYNPEENECVMIRVSRYRINENIIIWNLRGTIDYKMLHYG